MAVINRSTLVLNSVSVVRGVGTGTVGMGFDSASGKIAAIPFSVRSPSHPYPQAGQKTSPRQDHAARYGTDPAADRAGRPEGSGALASWNRVWSLATGETWPKAAWDFGRSTAKHPASAGNLLPERLLASSVEALGNGNPLRLPCAQWARRPAEAGPAGLEPVGGALLMSVRGFGF